MHWPDYPEKIPPPLLAELLKKMWYNQADMMPHTTMIMRKQVRRFSHE